MGIWASTSSITETFLSKSPSSPAASGGMPDLRRSGHARRRREAGVVARIPADRLTAPAADDAPSATDDTLVLLFLCCHPALTAASQIALTLRAVGGLTTTEIARAFLVPEPTMGQRISRAKQRIRASGVPFRLPPPQERDDRRDTVLQTLYLIFNEGYTATSGAALQRRDLATEAIRLTRLVHRPPPHDGQAAGSPYMRALVAAWVRDGPPSTR